jgi:hypothetical protein
MVAHTRRARPSAIAHRPVSVGGRHPDRLTAGAKASAGGVPSAFSVHSRMWAYSTLLRAAASR